MRQGCAQAMLEIGERDPSVVAMGSDGYSIFTAFAEKFPGRFIDVGIAEANLIGVAAGLARGGKRVFAGAIASFLLRRAYEQIRNDICDAELPVTLVGVGGGFSYGMLGATHHIIEDFALAAAMPAMSVFAPADVHEARAALHAAAALPGPSYIRLGAREDPVLHEGSVVLRRGVPLLLRTGESAVVFATGICVHEALLAAAELEREGIEITIASVPWLEPLSESAVAAIAASHRFVLTVEEHLSLGGLGRSVRDALAHRGDLRVTSLSVEKTTPATGTREELLSRFGIDSVAIATNVRRFSPPLRRQP